MNSNHDVNKNITKALSFIEEAAQKGAKFILLPEVFTFRRQDSSIEIPFDSDIDNTLNPFLSLAQKYKVFILCGSVYEQHEGGKGFNTSLLINDEGKIIAKYQKIHLFSFYKKDKVIKESHDFKGGKLPCLSKIYDRKLGLSICYDLRFPELYRLYQRLGAEMLAIPASFTRPTGEKHWKVLCQARAIENQCFVLAPNQVGLGAAKIASYGNSLIVGPQGDILGQGSDNNEEIIFATLDFDELEKTRKEIPVKNDRHL